jgi:hypothetical protein
LCYQRLTFHRQDFSEMALPIETMTMEEKQLERAKRAREWEAWPKSEEYQRLQHRAAGQTEEFCQKLEDVLTAPPPATLAEETERWRAGVRAALKKGREQYKQLKLGALGGELAIETVCEPIEEVEGMTEEELKRWKAFKKPAKGGGGKMRGGKAAAKPAATATAAGGGFGGQQAGGGYGGQQSWGWGFQQPPGPPQQFYGQWQAPWGNEGWAGGSQQQGQGTSGGGGRATMLKSEKHARFPCDNCGMLGHWAYDMECPNYEIYLAKQRAKAEELRKAKAGSNSGGVVALRNNTGKISVTYTKARISRI